MIVKVWHGEGHDDYTTTEMTVQYADFTEYVRDLYATGGFRYGDKFVPWHKVNFVERVG